MITEGSYTLLDYSPYICVKIEDGMAFLKKVGDETRGRFRKMDAELVPYMDGNNKLIVPKPPPVSRKRMTRFHYMKTVKDEVELPLSHDIAYYVAEWLDHIVRQLAHKAEANAIEHGDDRITSAHWYWLDMMPHEGLGKWPDNVSFAKDYKEYLRHNKEIL